MEKPYIFQSFDEYYRATKSHLSSRHQDFHIFRYADISPDVVKKMNLFRFTFFQFSISEESFSKITIAGNQDVSKDKQLIIFSPGNLIQWEKMGEWHGYIIFVKESFLKIHSINVNARLKFQFLRPDKHPITNLTNEDFLLLSELCEKMIYEYQSLAAENLYVIENLLQVLLIYICRIQESTYNDTPELGKDYLISHLQIHNQFLALVEKQFLEHKSVGLFAEQLNITAGYLNECVKAVSGKSAKKVINDVVLLEAKSLLKQTNIPIKEIAYRLNFQDYAHFVKFFKAEAGSSPAAYREII